MVSYGVREVTTRKLLGILLFFELMLASNSAFALEAPVLRIGLESEPKSLKGSNTGNLNDRFFNLLISKPVLKFDFKSRKLICALCTSWELRNGGKEIRIDLPL